MKYCANNAGAIALLAANTLDAEPARALRAHLSTCSGCREYWLELSRLTGRLNADRALALPESDPSFHRRLVNRIRADGTKSSATPASVNSIPAWRWLWQTVSASTAIVVLTLLILSNRHQTRTTIVTAPPAPMPSAPTIVIVTDVSAISNHPAEKSPSALSTYRRAANTSLEALEDLITEQAFQPTAPAESLTLAAVAGLNGED